MDEVVNIGVAVRERYCGQDGTARCLKLLLTDGGCWAADVPPHSVSFISLQTRAFPFRLESALFPPAAATGVQQVAAVEYRPTPALHSTMPAGAKVAVTGAAVRRGLLLLTPQTVCVLGGQVARLEEARQRMVTHWTQPMGEAGVDMGKRGARSEVVPAECSFVSVLLVVIPSCFSGCLPFNTNKCRNPS